MSYAKNAIISCVALICLSACGMMNSSSTGTVANVSSRGDWFCKYYESCDNGGETMWFWKRKMAQNADES